MSVFTKKNTGASPYTETQNCTFIEEKMGYSVYRDDTTLQFFAKKPNGVSYPLFDPMDKDTEPVLRKVVADE